MEIIGDLKLYDWGKLGLNSEVAKLAKLNSNSFEPDENKPFAELWMGDHTSGPSTLKSNGLSLSDYVSSDKDNLIGGMSKLPFLFKVLSIRKALSIQVHPSKEEAERLFAEKPDLYKDPNHKPELAIALTPFLALCGFRPIDEIYLLLQKYPDLIELIGKEKVDELKSQDGLKLNFSQLMLSKQENLEKCIKKLENRFKSNDEDNKLIADIFLTLNKDFPNDVGTLCLFFLNIIQLQPGQAIYLAAKEPHAYLDGDCIECMACSDNVVRAGLTPKFKDIETLINMLSYQAEPASSKIFQPVQETNYKYVELFLPKVKDFAVAKITIPKGETSYKIPNRRYGSILLVLMGESKADVDNYPPVELKRGSIVFYPSNSGPTISLNLPGDKEFIAYQAMYNDF